MLNIADLDDLTRVIKGQVKESSEVAQILETFADEYHRDKSRVHGQLILINNQRGRIFDL